MTMIFFPPMRQNAKNDAVQIKTKEQWQSFLFGHQELLCHCFALDPSKYKFTEEEVAAIVELGEVLREIRCDMIKEGYNIIDGKVQKIETVRLD